MNRKGCPPDYNGGFCADYDVNCDACWEQWKGGNMTEELQPCPFCGGNAELSEETDIFFRAFVVRCTKCGVAQAYPKYETEQEAIKAWNRRAET